MKSGADFQQRRRPAAHGDPSFRRCGDPAQQFQQSGFARSVVSDNAQTIPLIQFERNVPQRPEIFQLQTHVIGLEGVSQPPENGSADFGQVLIEPGILAAAVSDDIFFAEMFRFDCQHNVVPPLK